MIAKLVETEKRLSCPDHGPYNDKETGRQYTVVEPITRGEKQLECYSFCKAKHPTVPAVKVDGYGHVGFAPIADLVFDPPLDN